MEDSKNVLIGRVKYGDSLKLFDKDTQLKLLAFFNHYIYIVLAASYFCAILNSKQKQIKITKKKSPTNSRRYLY